MCLNTLNNSSDNLIFLYSPQEKTVSKNLINILLAYGRDT